MGRRKGRRTRQNARDAKYTEERRVESFLDLDRPGQVAHRIVNPDQIDLAIHAVEHRHSAGRQEP